MRFMDRVSEDKPLGNRSDEPKADLGGAVSDRAQIPRCRIHHSSRTHTKFAFFWHAIRAAGRVSDPIANEPAGTSVQKLRATNTGFELAPEAPADCTLAELPNSGKIRPVDYIEK